jgi:hypothetical protein
MPRAATLLGAGDTSLFPAAEAKRVRMLMAKHTCNQLLTILNISKSTLDEARTGGRMRAETRDRIVAKLDAIDAAKGDG